MISESKNTREKESLSGQDLNEEETVRKTKAKVSNIKNEREGISLVIRIRTRRRRIEDEVMLAQNKSEQDQLPLKN